MKVITGGVTAAKGFEAAGVEAAIKYKNRKDMAIIYSKKPCVMAGTFTSNVVKAAPVLWDKKGGGRIALRTGCDCQCGNCKCLYRKRGV